MACSANVRITAMLRHIGLIAPGSREHGDRRALHFTRELYAEHEIRYRRRRQSRRRVSSPETGDHG
jgi:hypothetical protein